MLSLCKLAATIISATLALTLSSCGQNHNATESELIGEWIVDNSKSKGYELTSSTSLLLEPDSFVFKNVDTLMFLTDLKEKAHLIDQTSGTWSIVKDGGLVPCVYFMTTPLPNEDNNPRAMMGVIRRKKSKLSLEIGRYDNAIVFEKVESSN